MSSRNSEQADPPLHHAAPSDFPPGAAIQHVAFVAERRAQQEVLLELPSPIDRRAVLATPAPDPSTGSSGHDLTILKLPTTNLDDVELLSRAQEWVDAAPGRQGASHLMTLQGAQVLWTEGRVAVLAQSSRLDAVCNSLIEVFFYDAELRDLEVALADTWAALEADSPLAFEFTRRSIPQRKRLQQRFQQVLLMRARLGRIAPHVHCPHVHPATLASQVGERLKERLRTAHRQEFLTEQLELFQQVYDSCSQRASDYALTQSGNTLEWVIIVLLAIQVLFNLFEILTTLGS